MPASPAPQHLEDLHDCLRLAQMDANLAHDRQQHGQQWFSFFLKTLEDCGVELFERTTKSFNCTPTDAVFEEVFAGWIPPPQSRNQSFRRVASDVLNGLRQPDLALLCSTSTSSHMRIGFDHDDPDSPVALVFHLWCTTAADTPRTRLTLHLDHLGARLLPQAFEVQRVRIEARLRALSDLDQI
ncbi:hypothetical protein [Pseudomonas sp. CM27]|uniref:hypothetical protein n=1 Tax=Pseudomonas sp. CM27 TaxID=2738452 RepID=UPI00155410D5|nr:hypothetical protein [Pseudomonas sp. CM27]